MTATLLLVHGAWHGDWCWEPLLDELQDVNVRTVELPSSGPDLDRLGGMHDDAQVVRKAVESIEGPAVVCAHSYGGIPVSDGLAGVSNVQALIYLCAFQLDVGESLPAGQPGRAPAWWDVHEQEGYVDVRDPEHVFYNDCPPEVATWASARLTHQSLTSWRQPLRAAAWRAIPSTYVVCTEDAAIPPSLQERMATRARQRLSLEASHSPFLSQPVSVANLLRGLLEKCLKSNGA